MVENPLSEGLKDCPFRSGNCIASNCMIWIGKHDRTSHEDVGHCAIVKTHQGIIGLETALAFIIVLNMVIAIAAGIFLWQVFH